MLAWADMGDRWDGDKNRHKNLWIKVKDKLKHDDANKLNHDHS